MKIYCILIDTLHETPEIKKFFGGRNFTDITQISNCSTLPSLLSLFTGKLPSDLIDRGIGYHSWKKYQKMDGSGILWPFHNEFMFKDLYENDWDVELHFPDGRDWWCWLELISDPKVQITSVESHDIEEDILYCLDGDIVRDHFKKEKEYIQSIQTSQINNKFHFVRYGYYHIALCAPKKYKNSNIESITIDQHMDLLNSWDFDEPDSLFWVFQDHGNWKSVTHKAEPSSFYTWAKVKDNTQQPLSIESKYISICDFVSIVLKKAGIEKGDSVLDNPVDKNRIYYVDDSRAADNLYRTTTYIACKFIDWVGEQSSKLLSISYNNTKGLYYSFIYDIKKKEYTELEQIDESLKQSLIQRFKGEVK